MKNNSWQYYLPSTDGGITFVGHTFFNQNRPPQSKIWFGSKSECCTVEKGSTKLLGIEYDV